jgi:signal transduction histidine kinase
VTVKLHNKIGTHAKTAPSQHSASNKLGPNPGSGETNAMSSLKNDKSPQLPKEIRSQLRSLAHDLSNSLETILQASYLLSQARLDARSRKWVELLDDASKQATRLNREIRELLKSHTE